VYATPELSGERLDEEKKERQKPAVDKMAVEAVLGDSGDHAGKCDCSLCGVLVGKFRIN